MAAEQELILVNKRIKLAESPVMYDRPFSAESFREDWEVRTGQWQCQDGAFVGKNPQPGPGCIISRTAFPFNVMMDCRAQTILPSTHDIDIMWNVTWEESTNTRGIAYVTGIQGWWDGKVGIEKSPAYKLFAGVRCPWFQPGREYHIQTGSINGHCFVSVNGELKLEMMDPDPIDCKQSNRVGFEAYQSWIRIRDLKVRQIVWEPREAKYSQEF